jgi:hypothetical protein
LVDDVASHSRNLHPHVLQSGKLGSASNLSKEGSGSGFRGLSSVSMAAGTGSAAPAEEDVPRGHTRAGFVVVPLDGSFRGEAVRQGSGWCSQTVDLTISLVASYVTAVTGLGRGAAKIAWWLS